MALASAVVLACPGTGRALPAGHAGGTMPAVHPGGGLPAGHAGGALPAGHPGDAIPAGHPGGALPAGHPGGAMPAGHAGGALPAVHPGGALPAGHAGGTIAARHSGKTVPAGHAGGTMAAGRAGAARAELPFRQRFGETARGGMARAGNSVVSCYPPASSKCTSQRDGTGANNLPATFLDVDSDGSTFNSSTADLSMPAGATVKLARLYWGGRSETNDSTPGLPAGNKTAPDFAARGTVKLKTPGGSYQDVTAAAADMGQTNTDSAYAGDAYGASADVTSLVAAAGAGTYTAADVQTARGSDGLGAFGGWSLVVVYEDAGSPLRNLTLYDGYLYQESSDPPTTGTVSGFQTPTNGTVHALLGEIVYDGDSGIEGDYTRVKTTNGPQTTLSDAAHPANDFFNSAVATLGANETARDPSYSNNLGYDSSVIDASSAFRNGDTDATFSIGTSGDTYWPHALYSQIDLNEPKIDLTKSAAVVGGGPAQPGAEVEYTINAESKGPDDAVESVLTDSVPAGTTYVPGSLKVASGANAGDKTDASGDDQGEVAGGKDITVRLGSGADATKGGTLAVGDTTSVTFRVKLNNESAGTTVTNTATVEYGGADYPSERTKTTADAKTPVAKVQIAKTASPRNPLPGDKVTYTVKVSNPTDVDYNGVDFTDDLTKVLDDATYDNDATASSGTVGYTAPKVTWNGDVPAKSTVTVTYSVTVKDPPTGDLVMTNAVTSTTPETNCTPAADGSPPTDPACSTSQNIPKLQVKKTSTPDEPKPGEKVTYKVTVENVGKADYPGASFTDDLTAVLDDATYDNDGTADKGTVSYAAPKLTWTGDLKVGETATVTYSVTVKDPPTGDQTMTNAVVASGSNCVDGKEADCHNVHPVPKLTVKKVAAPTDPLPGGKVTYTVTIANNSKADYLDATLTDDLTGVLDDATYNNDATADSGTTSYAEPKLTWNGDVAQGQTVTITYSVTVKSPPGGDDVLKNAVVVPGSNCADGKDPDCGTVVPVPELKVRKTASPKVAKPGETVTYTTTVENVGQADYPGASLTDDLTGVLDDATYDKDASADSGTVSYAEPKLTWNGDVAKGQTVTITYSVTLNDPTTGDGILKNAVVSPGSNCILGTEPACHTINPEPTIEFTKKASPQNPAPGGTVKYTITVTNPGRIIYTGASFTDDLTGTLDDATYNNDATATGGTASYAAPVLSWQGNVRAGQTVTITYSVTLKQPATGDGRLTNAVVSDNPGGNCPPGSTDPRCNAVVPVPDTDFGDAPDSYKTKYASGGPYHWLTKGLTLGTTSTAERDAPDRLDGTSDGGEDAVRGHDPLIKGDTSFAQDVAVRNTTRRPALLAAWIDFNRSGTFEPGELATSRVPAGATKARLSWSKISVPAAGLTYARARLYGDPTRLGGYRMAAPKPGPAGYGGRGEVEDYPLTIRPGTPKLHVVKTSSAGKTVKPGSRVRYTLTIKNVGNAAFTSANPAVVTDDLSGVLDDARYDNDARASAPTVSYKRPKVTWRGPLAVGATVTVTYSVTVRKKPHGDTVLRNTVVAPNSNCQADASGKGCGTRTRVRFHQK
ncbi:DUF11 domain-containing protein [Actinomadura barringtoniae]|uniref:DUF11 domain-containing protein n=1 Tax=Actinomadura barringtoniae TaxID=1427535 RepID=A0A939PCN0_9ACTN|nr:isopeptide-forming domain-containing fimbrial protein [Actinomadura barringtoniae]MBO2446026.1 DUF11 domain-containing protein [Actinomadura barringtoniae]